MNPPYHGEMRRKDDSDGPLQDRVRDLEESDRASTKSRQAMHKQIGDLDSKMDSSFKALSAKLDYILSQQIEKVEECGEHKTETALLKQAQTEFVKGMTAMADAIKTLQTDQKRATHGAIVGLLTALFALGGYIWNKVVR